MRSAAATLLLLLFPPLLHARTAQPSTPSTPRDFTLSVAITLSPKATARLARGEGLIA